jgi:hypothetical protein
MFVVSIPYLDAMTTYDKDLWGRGVRFALVPLGIVVSFSILASGYWTSLLFTSRFGHPFVDEVFGSIFGLLAYWFILSAIGTARIFGQDAMSMYIAKTANVPLAVAVVYLSVSLGLFGLSFARF